MTMATFPSPKLLVEINFYISVIVLVLGSILPVSGAYPFFEFNEELYGPVANNLRIMMVYLAIAECILVGYCFLSKRFRIFIVAGAFLISMTGYLAFYGAVNNMPIDSNLHVFFLYTGISPILLGVISARQKNGPGRPHESSDLIK
ncbi:conserved membrane hypothetical protein [Candidatus Methylobacter favarea]|uniref:Uncharacterized protein n=1 Tax=Candidatus Methylobacter favarea TaxID=2707345 RepID=A0A8S0XJ97_9GAMM|nr:hypothetical protein [Candidatus Methylobacter favarea]CAA9893003.1 conserved membrane hypothetical protein [Candidatus Methylobacter favarea]